MSVCYVGTVIEILLDSAGQNLPSEEMKTKTVLARTVLEAPPLHALQLRAQPGPLIVFRLHIFASLVQISKVQVVLEAFRLSWSCSMYVHLCRNFERSRLVGLCFALIPVLIIEAVCTMWVLKTIIWTEGAVQQMSLLIFTAKTAHAFEFRLLVSHFCAKWG